MWQLLACLCFGIQRKYHDSAYNLGSALYSVHRLIGIFDGILTIDPGQYRHDSVNERISRRGVYVVWMLSLRPPANLHRYPHSFFSCT
jgi:hypothetical protein